MLRCWLIDAVNTIAGMLLVKAFLINVIDAFGSFSITFLADQQTESNAQGIVESSSSRCFSRKHDSAKLDLLNGQLFFVMNSLHTLNFTHAVKKLVLLVSTA